MSGLNLMTIDGQGEGDLGHSLNPDSGRVESSGASPARGAQTTGKSAIRQVRKPALRSGRSGVHAASTFLLGAIIWSAAAIRLAAGQAPMPFDWKVAPPGSEGFSTQALAALKDKLASRNTTGFLLIRHDRIVSEWYSIDFNAAKTHYTASMAKALVGGVCTALALNDGRIALDEPVAEHIPAWKADPQKSKITLRQLGSHTSGLDDAEENGLPHEQLTGWKGDFWKRLNPPHDPFTIARDLTPLKFAPGESKQYSNPGMAMLGWAITASLKDGADLRSLLRTRVLRPIGVADQEWSIGYGQTVTVDNLPLVATWGGGSFTARAVARVARLMLHEGEWEGRRLISREAVQAVTRDAGTPGNAGIGWWSNNEGAIACLPRDAFWGSGAGHQIVLVAPSLDLIAVRNGDSLAKSADYDRGLAEFFFEPLMAALTANPERAASISPGAIPDRAPYPASAAIQGIRWEAKETIIRQARGSDNWPMTWADDDALYTAYGDGNGFEPFVPEKLSLGLAVVQGQPPNFSGRNIRSPSLEQKGEGRDGKKAGGLLMVDGILYLWARNAGNSQLAWSIDHGAAWSWSLWKFTNGFGCPTFLNFGRNYSGAPDDFVYTYSPDAESAYDPADHFVLARVRKTRIKDRDAYEFFRRLDSAGRPEWTKSIAERGAVFSNRGKCYRSSITYHPGLKRYLWSQTHPGGDARFQGGFAVYDAPEPWGPWTTVFSTDAWDVGPGETSSFPTKWMDRDGRSVWLVFSGDDSFSVRRGTLILPER